MAKMFYTLEEAAEQLGVETAQVEAMVENGQLQQFRDGEKIMFKCDQVDALAGGGEEGGGSAEAGEAAEEGGEPPLAEDTSAPSVEPSPAGGQSDEVTLSDTGAGDANAASGSAIPLAETGHGEGGEQPQQPRSEQTGVDVFSTSEVDNSADPGEETQVTAAQGGQPQGESEEMSLESAGSGSGLLDLTRESDDTSLGAELFDELYPAEGGQQGGDDTQAGAASSGVMEGMSDTGAGGTGMGSGAQTAEPSGTAAGAPAPAAAQPAPQTEPAAASEEPAAFDPAGNGLGGGFMLGSALVLIVGMIVSVAAVLGMNSTLAATMTASAQSFYLWIGGLLVVSVVFGLLGMAMGNAAAKGGGRGRRAG